MKSRSTVLKAANMKWLVSLAAFDAAVVLLFVAPGLIDASTLALLRAGSATALPVLVLLFTGLLSHDAKARLVFWKIANPLPGSAAFTKHAPADARIDMAALAKNVGALPTDPGQQNAMWYKLYRLVGDDPAVSEAHKLYLMYRDMAVMSLSMVPLAPAAIWYAGAPAGSLWIASGLFAVQYVMCAVAARHSGTRFVCNVLAIHSTTKVKAKTAAQ
ncbi:hypothetical protein ACH79_40285 [Bradyrhizobium sp. CCBAU 051011]|uniref:hypothetical protein n=1 Tax=Bradyrhizobium sp. CCBAU 051011 TaxID=858422 RepID=UPI0013744D6C|nr:hypothetical protein [Bradyrhizobium sp. CCBAU 051011]QHO77906.1 hypothetical protein ACH79_40285 [Bradyrhizobium sp. CCBAU 051011]